MTGRIDHAERFLLWIPMVQRVRREMERAFIHSWSEIEVVRLGAGGVAGFGETVQNYTWGRVAAPQAVGGCVPQELVLSRARWPAIPCHELYEHPLVGSPLPVSGGFGQVPQGAGAGGRGGPRSAGALPGGVS